NRNVEQFAAQSVVYARDERLLVLAFLSARHHVELASQNGLDELGDVFRLELQIRGIEYEHVAARMDVARAQRICDPAAGAMSHGAEERVLGFQIREYRSRCIRRAVV